MSCYHPIRAWCIGKTDTGKRKLFFTPLSVTSIYKVTHGWLPCQDKYVPSGAVVKEVEDSFLVPCGQCAGCRLDRSRQWANRCMLEMMYHDSSYFITLTYDNDHLVEREFIDSGTGEVMPAPTLVKSDLSAFMKRLRKNTGQKLRFFGCGEYGSKTFRPHYHVIVFGLKLDDLVVYKRTPLGDVLYNSETVSKAWQYRGHVVVGCVTWESCAYTARYITKKLTGKLAKVYSDMHIEPEFSLMSRRPGIARQYYEDHKDDLYDYDFINVSTLKGGRKFRPPKYFDTFYEFDYPERYADEKEKRVKYADEVLKARLAETDLSLEDYLKVSEEAFLNRTKILKERDLT